MPIPFILGAGAVVAGAVGVGNGISGAAKMKEASDTLNLAEKEHQANIERFGTTDELTSGAMDELGRLELSILKNFEIFSDTMEKIQNRPIFQAYEKKGIKLPKYDAEELEKVSIGAGILLAALGGAAMGTAGGFAAAGATTSAVMALGTASTGTAIASLSGAAATNATLAALGGGALGGTIGTTGIASGGIALGETLLTAATAGAALFVGGIIFNKTGTKMSDKAETAYEEMKNAEKTIDEICNYLEELKSYAIDYIKELKDVESLYLKWFAWVSFSVNQLGKRDWNEFTEEEKVALQNTVLLVGLLYRMCQINFVLPAEKGQKMNSINKQAIKENKNYKDEITKELA